MFCLLLALQAPVLAGPSGDSIGIEGELPAQPESKKPTWHWRKEAGIAGEQTPEVLVPIGFINNKTNWWGRYYDEQGQVYRKTESVLVMKNCECIQPDVMADYDRLAFTASIWTSVGAYGLIFTGGLVSIPAYVVGGIYAGKAEIRFGEALVEYNQGDRASE